MRTHKLNVLLPAVALAVCASAAAAQTVAPYPPAAAPYPPADQPREVIIVQPSQAPAVVEYGTIVPPQGMPQPDPSAEVKCRYASSIEYWDCVNSHNGGG